MTSMTYYATFISSFTNYFFLIFAINLSKPWASNGTIFDINASLIISKAKFTPA